MTPARPSWPPSEAHVAFWNAIDEWARARYKPGEKNTVRAEKAVVKVEAAAVARFTPPAPEADPERIAQLIAHRACHSAEHDPQAGKLHGFCIVCGVPWPCEYAGKPPAPPAPEVASEEEIDKWLRSQGWTLIQPEDYDFIRAALAKWGAAREERKP